MESKRIDKDTPCKRRPKAMLTPHKRLRRRQFPEAQRPRNWVRPRGREGGIRRRRRTRPRSPGRKTLHRGKPPTRSRSTSLRWWPRTEPAGHAHAQPQYLRRDLAGAREKQSIPRGWVGTPTPRLPWRTEDGAETSTGGAGWQCGHLAVLRDRPRVRPQSQSLTSDG